MPLGTEVGFGPGHIVLDGEWGPSSLPPWKRAQQPPLFGPCLLWANGRPSQQLLSCCLNDFMGSAVTVSTAKLFCH